MQVFVEVKYLYKQLQLAMTSIKDRWDTIAIVIAFDFLYNYFDTTTASLLEINNKIID